MAASVLQATSKKLSYGVDIVTIRLNPADIDPVDGAIANFTLPRARAIGVQMIADGTFGTKTVSLLASPNQVNYAALPTAVSRVNSGLSSVALADCAYHFYRISIDGQPPDEIRITVIANTDI